MLGKSGGRGGEFFSGEVFAPAGPVFEQGANDGAAGAPAIFQGGFEAGEDGFGVVVGFAGEVEMGGPAGRGQGVIADAAQEEDAAGIGAAEETQLGKSAEGADVFHGGGGEAAAAAGPVGGPFFSPGVVAGAVPEAGGGENVATANGGGKAAGAEVGVGGAGGGEAGWVEEREVPGEVIGPGGKGAIEVEDLVVVAEEGGVAGHRAVGLEGAEGEDAGFPIGGMVGGVEVVGGVAVDDPFGPEGAAEGANGGVAAGDAGDEPVGAAEVDAGEEGEGEEAGGGFYGADTGDEGGDAVVIAPSFAGLGAVEVPRAEAEAFAEAGELTLAAGGRLEHGDDHHFDFLGRHGGGWAGNGPGGVGQLASSPSEPMASTGQPSRASMHCSISSGVVGCLWTKE